MIDLPFVDAKVHSELVSSRMKRLLRVEKFLNSGVKFDLSVSGGVLDGLSSETYARSYTFGQDLNSDTVLFDEGISDQHLELRFKTSVFGPVVSAIALGPGVVIEGEPVAPNEASKYLSLPVTVSVFDTTIEVKPHRNENPIISKEIRNRLYRSRYVMAFVLFCLFSWQLAQSSALNMTLALGGPELPYDIVQSDQIDKERFARLTRTVAVKLDELGLADKLTAQINNTGALELAGTLQSDKLSDWRAFREWYDENEKFVLLSNVSITPTVVNLPAIASIKLSDPQMVILIDGEQIRVGDVLFEDVKLLEIHEDHFVLLRQNEELAVSFSGLEVSDG